jgi:hypothetical protein
MRFTGAILSLVLLAFLSSSGGSAILPAGGSKKQAKAKDKVVYVLCLPGDEVLFLHDGS